MDAGLSPRRIDLDGGLVLRHLTVRDSDRLYAAVMANFDHLRTYLHWVVPGLSRAAIRDFITGSKRSAAEGTGQNRGMFLEGEFSGMIGFVKIDRSSRYAEIGYWIAEGRQGRGIVTRSCRALLDYAFGDLRLNRVEIRCAGENVRSRAVPERLGFQLEGVLRRSQWRHERFYDLAIYWLLADEWPSSSKL